MFERRLKIFLGILIGITIILLFRAAHLQLANGDYWRSQASQAIRRRTLVEPVRGKIVDTNGQTLAEDIACIDAAVDYRAIDLDGKWLKEQAKSRLIARFGLDQQIKRNDLELQRQREEIEKLKAETRER